ncbi:DDE_Tnp_IS1595 domain-containing protein [Trichonephila clavipes]|nr:DDE_Tnp_IS1595 domain-containing protein [Trichonephila clavipes]
MRAKLRRGNIIGDILQQDNGFFGRVERETGRCFLDAVHDRMAEILLKSLIKPGTTVISDCWNYEKLGEKGYDHRTVNHSLKFVKSKTGAHANTIEVTRYHFLAGLARLEGYITWYMFGKICFTLKEDSLIKFLNLVPKINWGDWEIISGCEVQESKS